MLIERHLVSRPLVIGGGNLSQAVLASLSWRPAEKRCRSSDSVSIRSSGSGLEAGITGTKPL